MYLDVVLKEQSKKYKVFIDDIDILELQGKVAIVTNPKISGLWLDDLLSKIKCDEKFIITIPDGEEHKNLSTCEYVLNQLFISNFDRSSTLISFGGGVVSDITGFVASIYKRGIKFINIPTTLLSQVDASVGGKTGVNNLYGKNLIGSFYQPKAVYCSVKYLDTLDDRQFRAGIVEIIKMAVMFDKEMFEILKTNNIKKDKNLLKAIIKRSIELKAMIVKQDEKEQGVRAMLNYGHTFGHVVEKQGNYKKYLHGEAVAVGIVMANYLACKLGLLCEGKAKEIKELLLEYGLRVDYKINSADSFYDLLLQDKKAKDNDINFILAKDIGCGEIVNGVKKEIVLKILSEFA